MVKNHLQSKRPTFSPWVAKIPWRRAWQSTPVLLPGGSQGQRSLEGCSPWGRAELGVTGRLSRQHCREPQEPLGDGDLLRSTAPWNQGCSPREPREPAPSFRPGQLSAPNSHRSDMIWCRTDEGDWILKILTWKCRDDEKLLVKIETKSITSRGGVTAMRLHESQAYEEPEPLNTWRGGAVWLCVGLRWVMTADQDPGPQSPWPGCRRGVDLDNGTLFKFTPPVRSNLHK